MLIFSREEEAIMLCECAYNDFTGKRPSMNDCEKCREQFDLPYESCCLELCNDCEIEECEKYEEM